jgi:Yip1 domain
MSIVEPGGAPTSSAIGIVARAQALLLQPTAEWKKIEPEPATIQGLYTSWLAPLAIIPAICTVIMLGVIGVGMPGFAVFKLPLLTAVIHAVVQFAVFLGMTYVFSLVIDYLAPNFGGQKNQIQAFKVAAYTPVAVCLASVLQLVPFLGGFLMLFGLYSLYIMHRGIGVLMKPAADKTTGYTVSVVVVMIIVGAITMWILGAVMPINRSGIFNAPGVPGIESRSADQGSITINGTTVDIGAIEKAARQMEQATNGSGGDVSVTLNSNPVDVEKLKALLPDTLAGLPRTEISTGGAAGMGGASAVYEAGDKRLEVSIADLGAMGALGGMAGAFSATSSRETADGYERTRTVDGRMTVEKFSRGDRTATYGTLVANRFMLNVDGRNASPDEVKAAVNAIGVARVEAAARN